MVLDSDRRDEEKIGLCEGCAEMSGTSFEWLENISMRKTHLIWNLNELKERAIWSSEVKLNLGRGNRRTSPSDVKGLGLFEEGKECQCEVHRELK